MLLKPGTDFIAILGRHIKTYEKSSYIEKKSHTAIVTLIVHY